MEERYVVGSLLLFLLLVFMALWCGVGGCLLRTEYVFYDQSLVGKGLMVERVCVCYGWQLAQRSVCSAG